MKRGVAFTNENALQNIQGVADVNYLKRLTSTVYRLRVCALVVAVTPRFGNSVSL